jgi:predicted dinucleotide-binding enzyme
MKVTIVGAGNMGRGVGTRTVAGQQPLNLGFASAVKLHP